MHHYAWVYTHRQDSIIFCLPFILFFFLSVILCMSVCLSLSLSVCLISPSVYMSVSLSFVFDPVLSFFPSCSLCPFQIIAASSIFSSSNPDWNFLQLIYFSIIVLMFSFRRLSALPSRGQMQLVSASRGFFPGANPPGARRAQKNKGQKEE